MKNQTRKHIANYLLKKNYLIKKCKWKRDEMRYKQNKIDNTFNLNNCLCVTNFEEYRWSAQRNIKKGSGAANNQEEDRLLGDSNKNRKLSRRKYLVETEKNYENKNITDSNAAENCNENWLTLEWVVKSNGTILQIGRNKINNWLAPQLRMDL